MTPPEMVALGQRAASCPCWRWVPGMLAGAHRCIAGPDDESGWFLIVKDEGEPASWWPVLGFIPDLADPATLGCLLALVCEAWGDPDAHLVRFHTHDQPNGPGTDLVPAVWWALAFGDSNEARRFDRLDGSGYYLAGPTRAHALVAALKAAP